MAASVRATAVASQAPSVATEMDERAMAVASSLARLRAVVSDLGYTLDALASAMGKDEGYKGYLSRVLNGEKPLTLDFIVALPDDIEAEFHARSSEAFGRIVVAPVSGPDAVKQFTAGLFGLLSGAATLPAKAGAPIKATLDSTTSRRRA